MKRSLQKRLALACVLAGAACFSSLYAGAANAAEVKVALPLPRTLYQTNEAIPVTVLRSDKAAIAAGTLTATLTADDGSKLVFNFPVGGVAVTGDSAMSTEHLNFNARLLRPGKYTLEVACDGATGKTAFEIYSHVRQSTFRLVNWGSPNAEGQHAEGEDSMGYNLMYGPAALQKKGNFLIAGGVDQMSTCTMSGGHQMDLRMECDWSDPLVSQGGTRRTTRRALADRTDPNVIGVHFYDEPGLTWEKDAETGDTTPHAVTSQHRAYEAAFGKMPLRYNKLDPSKPESVAAWTQWATWKLGFMDAAWKDANFGVTQVNANYLGLTQSQYGFSAFTDGYAFNVVRSLPIISGHGGYDDWGPGYFNPSFTLELARGRDYARANWYLPLWYGATEANRARLEQYLSFITNIQGMITPPELEPANRPACRQSLVESNQLMKRLGTVFTTMPVTREPVAVLYSVSALINGQTKDVKNNNYAHAMPHGASLMGVMLAGVQIQQHVQTVVDEDIVDGTLAADHKAVVISAVDYLDPAVIKGLEDFASHGGLVLTTSDCTVKIAGATPLNAAWKADDEGYKKAVAEAKAIPATPENKEAIAKANEKAASFTALAAHLKNAAPLAKAMKAAFDKAGIKPVLTTDKNEIAVSRQGAGDVEYIFAVNATYDTAAGKIASLLQEGVTANLSIPTAGRSIYDAVVGGAPVGLKTSGDAATGEVRFGPGEMRAYAITARPIGSVKAATPTLTRNFTLAENPIAIRLGAAVLDNKGGLLSGSIPLEFTVIDPLGDARYTAFRATTNGVVDFALPLAANDPAGAWKVVVRELLSNTSETSSFNYTPAAQCGAVAGTAQRAVFFPGDSDNIFRFARNHNEVTIVVGSSAFDAPAAERVKKSIAPWGINAKIVKADDVNKAKAISEADARTFTGLEYTPHGQIKAGEGNPPATVGYAVEGAVILIGNANDNPLIKYLGTAEFLPYAAAPDSFPGRARGMIAWQRDAIGRNQESVALIAFDEAGINEAAGSFYEMVAGIEPLTKWALPLSNTLAPATLAAGNYRPAKTVSRAVLPDRVVGIKVEGDSATVLTHDGTLSTYSLDGKTKTSKTLNAADLVKMEQELATHAPDRAAIAALKDAVVPNRIVKFIVPAAPNGNTAVAYWGGTLQILDPAGKPIARQQLPQDPTALAWINGKLVVGLATGEVLALEVK
jgi:hypothetical protein